MAVRKSGSGAGATLEPPGTGGTGGTGAAPGAGAGGASGGAGASGDAGGDGSPGKKEKRQQTPMERILRSIQAQILEVENREELDEAVRFQIVDGLRGLKVLIDTRAVITDPKNPPAPDSAWGKVLDLGRSTMKANAIF